MPPRLLDLFCGAQGAGMGYVQAGFDVVGVDNRRCRPLPKHPRLTFIQADVRDVLAVPEFIQGFDVVHASPPCQLHSRTDAMRQAQGRATRRTDLMEETRQGLEVAGVPYAIENVPETPMRPDIVLCGSMFPELHTYVDGQRRFLQRHRLFEVGHHPLPPPPPLRCRHSSAGARALGVYGHVKGDQLPGGGQVADNLEQGRDLMGIDWMKWRALIEAVPPAYTRYVAGHMLAAL